MQKEPGYDLKRFRGKRPKSVGAKISKSLKQRYKLVGFTKEHCDNLSKSLTGIFSGSKNPMYGHIRSNQHACWCGKLHKCSTFEKASGSMKEMWKDDNYRINVIKGLSDFWESDDGKLMKIKFSEHMKEVYDKRISDNNGIHWNQTQEGRQRCREITLKLIEEGKINPATCNNSAPNKCEQQIIDLLNENNIDFRFVGDGQIWMTSSGKKYNPDFINIPSRKIIEYYGGIGFFHTLEEIEERHVAYSQIGWDHLAILEGELKDKDKILEKIKNFIGCVSNGWVISNIEIIDGEQDMINFHCEPNNNFFANKILTHNSYPDNSERFIDSFIKFSHFASIVGTKIKPLYTCANLLKTEQYILLNKLDYLTQLSKWLVSCDRPMLINGIPHNCSKDGKPACGSGAQSYWAAKMAGVADTRNYYVVDDEEYKIFEPNSSLSVKQISTDDILAKLQIHPLNLRILQRKLIT